MSAASKDIFKDDDIDNFNQQMKRQRSPSQASSTLSRKAGSQKTKT